MKKVKKIYEERESCAFGVYSFGPTPTEPQPDRYEFLGKLISAECEEKEIKLKLQIGNKTETLTISLPSFGGVRIHSEVKGFFNPEKTSVINSNLKNNIISFTTTDGSLIKIDTDIDNWSLSVLDKDKKTQVVLNKNSLRYGYLGDNLEKVKLTMPLGEEMLFGCGEKFMGLDQTGNRHQFWNCDAGYHGNSEFLELWKSYKNIPLIHSTTGFSLFYNSFYPAYSDLGYTEDDIWSWEFWGPTLDMYIWTGNVRKTVVQYTDLTGKSFLPPKWAFHYMSGGGNGFWYGSNWGEGNNPEAYLKVLEEVLEGYQKLGTPNVAALYGEGWIADNHDAYKMLKPYGTRMLNWNPPDYSLETMQKCLPGRTYEELPRIKMVSDPTKEAGNYIDFHNPNVKEMLINRYKDLFELGLRGGMLDFAEMVPDYALYCNGMTGREMHNFNPYWYGKLYGEAAKELVGDDYLYYCRGGCAGSQHWCANFSGDQAAKFFGLRQQLASALTLGVCGVSAWGGDMAGYEMKPEPDVFCRGMQFAAFQPLMRAHGTRTRCPWDFGDTAIEVYKKYYHLRENLVDMLYSSAIEASITGLPMIQAMALAYPEEKELVAVDTQYIFCDNLLVAPVFEQDAQSKEVYFPSGTWYDLWNGESIKGGVKKDIPVTIYDSPVYLREGTVMPLLLADDCALASPMSEDNKNKALLLTFPESKREYTFNIDKETAVTYITEKTGENSFKLTANGGILPQILLVYGNVQNVFSKDEVCEFTADSKEKNVTAIKLDDNKLTEIEIKFG